MRTKGWHLAGLSGALLLLGVGPTFLFPLTELGDRLNELLFRGFGVYLPPTVWGNVPYRTVIALPAVAAGIAVARYGLRNASGSMAAATGPSSDG